MEGLNRREFLAAAGASSGGALAASPSRPNILFLCCDNLNPKVLQCAGHPVLRTPNVDRPAHEGSTGYLETPA